MNDTTTAQGHSLQFHGKGSDFFKIWIVNIVLTVLTLGIYAAWAKVRTQRFFYQNTELAGSRFEYHAKPLSLLKGYLIVAAFIGAYVLASAIAPVLAGLLAISLMVSMPFLFVQALRFRLANSSYRGLRFSFQGTVGQVVKIFLKFFGVTILAGVLFSLMIGMAGAQFVSSLKTDGFSSGSLFTLVLLVLLGAYAYAMALAYGIQRIRLYGVNQASYGDSSLMCDVPLKKFLKVCSAAYAVMAVLVLAFALAVPALLSNQDVAALAQKASKSAADAEQTKAAELNASTAETTVQLPPDSEADIRALAQEFIALNPGDPRAMEIFIEVNAIAEYLSGQDLKVGERKATPIEIGQAIDAVIYDVTSAGATEATTAGEAAETPDTAVAPEENSANFSSGLLVVIVMAAGLYMMAFVLANLVKTQLNNLVWNHTEVANNHRFTSEVSPAVALGIGVSNLLLQVITLGLYTPFAKVRMARYKLSKMRFYPAGNLDQIVAGQRGKAGATGDSAADALGFDIGV